MTVPSFLPQFRSEFNQDLARWLENKKKQTKSSTIISEAIESMINITLAGGKRIRPAFIYYGYKICGGKSFENIKNYALSIELLHTFALIHDDIMDKSNKRRGIDTIHTTLGQSMAILCGDLAYSYSDELFYTKKNTEKSLAKVFEDMKQEVIYGQIIDISGPQSRNDAIDMMKWKTASYSVQKPLLIGAHLANASATQLSALSICGENIGLAFQTQDDIFGVFGDEKKLGKSVFDDMQTGKKHLFYFNTKKYIIGNAKAQFLNIWGNKSAGEKELKIIQKIMKESGGLKKTLEIYKQWKKNAQNAVNSTHFQEKYKQELVDIIDQILVLDKHDLVQ